MCKKLGYLFTLLLIFSLTLEARSFLYKISANGGTVYLMGSIHLAKPEIYPLNKRVTRAYDESDYLVVEVDPSSTASVQEMQKRMLYSGIYDASKDLQSELSPKTYQALLAYAKKSNININQMRKMKPWVVMLQVSITEMIRLGYLPELGIDKHFLDQAKQENKKIIELETAEQQMALLAKEDKLFQDKLLFYTLESMNELEPMLGRMFKAWKQGNTKVFEKIMTQPLRGDTSMEEVYDDLITKRNYQMADKIEGFIQSGENYFVIVGSGHIIGKDGIVSILRQRGYRLMQQ